jgi:hypothetical protein
MIANMVGREQQIAEIEAALKISSLPDTVRNIMDPRIRTGKRPEIRYTKA